MSNTDLTLAEKANDLASTFQKLMPAIEAMLPKHITPEKMLVVLRTAVSRNPKLMECSRISLFGALVEAGRLGLQPDGIGNQAHLVPFYNKRTKTFEAQLIPGYLGLLDLVRRSGHILSFNARAVYQGDDFDFGYGTEQFLRHKPDVDAEHSVDKLFCWYAVARFRNGTEQFEVLGKSEVDKLRKAALAKTNGTGPWATHYAEMGTKTAARRLCKWLPRSNEDDPLARAVGLDERGEAGIGQGLAGSLPPHVQGALCPAGTDPLGMALGLDPANAVGEDDEKKDEKKTVTTKDGTVVDPETGEVVETTAAPAPEVKESKVPAQKTRPKLLTEIAATRKELVKLIGEEKEDALYMKELVKHTSTKTKRPVNNASECTARQLTFILNVLLDTLIVAEEGEKGPDGKLL